MAAKKKASSNDPAYVHIVDWALGDNAKLVKRKASGPQDILFSRLTLADDDALEARRKSGVYPKPPQTLADMELAMVRAERRLFACIDDVRAVAAAMRKQLRAMRASARNR